MSKMEWKLKSITLLKRGEDGVRISTIQTLKAQAQTFEKTNNTTNPIPPHPALFDAMQACKSELLEAAEDDFAIHALDYIGGVKVDAKFKKEFLTHSRALQAEFAKKVVVTGISISDGKAKEGERPMNVVLSGYLVLKNNRVRNIVTDLIALNGSKRGFEPELEESVLKIISEAKEYDQRTEPEQLELLGDEDQN